MTELSPSLEEDILHLYREPNIGATYTNTYGEENIRNLVGKYHGLGEEDRRLMRDLVAAHSKSPDLAASFVSVGVLHALGMTREVEEAYLWARGLEDAERITHHFDIGKSLAEYFAR
ncbi:hypothetical protein UR09_01370 [Candidatus Nitromaritima sp. SCGC AAA799-A02]|nr:hypothetical protein UR09_01370 [Candidatus Nitromaritima sp. SCGC AAA799-A02]